MSDNLSAGDSAAVVSDTAVPSVHALQAWFVVGVLTLGWILAYLDRQIITILIEPLKADLHLSDTQVSLVQGFAFSLFFVAAGIPIGKMVDRHNRRNILVAGLVTWSIMTVACGLAGSFWQLFLARVGVGIGEACLAPASMSMVADLLPPRKRGTAMGILVSGTAIGNALSIFFGGIMLDVLSKPQAMENLGIGQIAPWQMIFFVLGMPGVVVTFLLLCIREPLRSEVGRLQHHGAFVPYYRSHFSLITLAYASFACSMTVGYGLASWFPVYLLRVQGASPATVGIWLGAILLIAGPTGAFLGGLLSDAFDRKYSGVGRFVVPLVALPLMALILAAWLFSDAWLPSLAIFALVGVLLASTINGSSYAALSQLVPNELRGQTIAFYLVLANLMGFGAAPTAIALITDYLLADPLKVKFSIIMFCVPVAAAGFIFSYFTVRALQRHHRSRASCGTAHTG